MTGSRTLTCLLLVLASACDIVVGPGQTTVLGNRGWVIGVDTQNAVNVQPGGTLVVEDADLFGRGRRIAPNEPDTEVGAAIVSNGGTVRILAGTIAGGNLLVDPNAQPGPPTMPPLAIGLTVDLLAPAINASNSLVEIEGGTFLSSGTFGGPFDLPRLVVAQPTVVVLLGELRIRGGVFGSGSRSDGSRSIGGEVTALGSRVDISGGSFVPGFVSLSASASRLRGGRFDTVLLQSGASLNGGSSPGCTEVSGGAFTNIRVSGTGERLLVLGSGFNFPLGRIALQPPTQTTFPSRVPGDPPIVIDVPTPFTLTGTLADGSALAVRLDVDADSEVVLATPGTDACPMQIGLFPIGLR